MYNEIRVILLCCSESLPCLFSYIRAPPKDRRTHQLKDISIATSEEKQKKKKTLRKWEYNRRQRDSEGVNNLKEQLIWIQTDGEAEKERQMAEKRDSGCFCRDTALLAKKLTITELDNSGCQPLSPAFSSHSLFISVCSVNLVSDNLSLSGSLSNTTRDTVLNAESHRAHEPRPALADTCTHLAFICIWGGSAVSTNAPMWNESSPVHSKKILCKWCFY